MANVGFYFMPIILAVSGSKVLKCNTYISVAIAGVMVHPSFLEFAASGNEFVNFLFLPVKAINYANAIFPMVFCLFVIKGIEYLTFRYLPKSVRTVLGPFLTLLVATPICLSIVAPIGSYLSDLLFAGISLLLNTNAIVAGLIIGALAPVMMLTGLHSSLIIITIMNLSTFGYDNFFPLLNLTNMVFAGVAFGAFLRLKDREEKGLAFSAFLVALISGTAEPTLYGIVVRYKRPFVPMVAVGAVVGALSLSLGCQATAIATGIVGIPAFLTTLPQYLICAVVAVLGAAAFTFFFGLSTKEAP